MLEEMLHSEHCLRVHQTLRQSKDCGTPFEFSELGMELAAIDDGVGDIRSIVREDMGKHHAEVQNKMLLMPLEFYDKAEYDEIEENYTFY